MDEVLAVGDAEFQKKCLGKMSEVSRIGKTVLFVSHQLGMLAQLCESCILLEKGNLEMQGKTENVINAYLNRKRIGGNVYRFDENEAAGKNAYFIYQKMVDGRGNEVVEITNEDPIILESKIRIKTYQTGMEVSLSLQNKLKGRIFTVNIPISDIMKNGEKEKVIRLEIPANFITPNPYSWISAVHVPGAELIDLLQDECDFIITDVGSKFSRYEGGDYGCVKLNQYNIETFD